MSIGSQTRQSMKNRTAGFSVIELMVTVAILGLLLAIAAPSYRAFVIDQRLTGGANEFLTMLNFARSEAVKRNARVTLCKSANGSACAGGGNWEQGWIAFVDAAPVGVVDVGDTVLRVRAGFEAGDTLIGDTDVDDYVSFVPDGRSLLANNVAQAGQIDLCTAGSSAGRRIALALGRVQASKITC